MKVTTVAQRATEGSWRTFSRHEATPETNRFDVYEIFDHNIAYEIRLKQALEEDLLSRIPQIG